MLTHDYDSQVKLNPEGMCSLISA